MLRWVYAALAVILLAGVTADAQTFGPPSGGGSCGTASTTVSGCVKVDGTTVTINGSGVISAPTGGSGNVTGVASSTTNDLATFSSTTGKAIQDSGVLVTGLAHASGMTSGQLAVAGSASTLTSSQAFGLTGANVLLQLTSGGLITPSTLPLATTSAFGAIEGDGSTTTLTAGVLSCTTSTNSQLGCVKPDGTTITISSGTLSASIAGANPSGTAGPTAVNGSATTYMRSDGAPAVQKATTSQFGIIEGDNLTTCLVSGVLGTCLPITNAASTGTTQFALAKLTGAGTAVIATTSDTGGVVLGAVQSGAGTSGTAAIAFGGKGTCIFDGATTQDDFVQVSTTTGGDCHDTGSTSFPTSGGQIVGRVLSTNASGGNYVMVVFPPAIVPGSGGGSATFTVTSKTTTYTLNGTTDIGVHFDNNGATGTAAFTLPSGSNGYNYCFMNLVSGQSITVTAPASIKISNGEVQSGGAGVLTLPNFGDGECLEYLQSQWFAYNGVGSWSLQ